MVALVPLEQSAGPRKFSRQGRPSPFYALHLFCSQFINFSFTGGWLSFQLDEIRQAARAAFKRKLDELAKDKKVDLSAVEAETQGEC